MPNKRRSSRYVQRGQSGFAGRSGPPVRGERGFSEGPPSRSQALYQQSLDERERAFAEKENERAYVENFGQKYHDYVDGMDATSDDFESDLRTFDYRSKKIPGLSDKIANKRAERDEWIAGEQAKAEQDKLDRKAEEERLKPIQSLNNEVVKSNLGIADQRNYRIYVANGDMGQAQPLLDKAYGLASASEQEAKEAAEREAQGKIYDAETLSGKATTARGKEQLAVLDSEFADLKAKKKAWDTFNEQTKKSIEEKTKSGDRPMKFDEKDKAEWADYQERRGMLQDGITANSNNTFRREQRKNAKKVDAPLSRAPKGGEAEFEANEFKSTEIDHNEKEISNNTERISSMEKRRDLRQESLEKAEQELRDWNAKALKAPEGTPFTDEELDTNTRLNERVEKMTMDILAEEEALTELRERTAQQEERNATLASEIDAYDEARYRDMFDDTGKFEADGDEKRYLAAFKAYRTDRGIKVNDKTYDYRRAFADGALTLDTEGELPSKYKLETEQAPEIDERGDGAKSRDILRGTKGNKDNRKRRNKR